MPPTALITGASSGIGKQLAIYHAKQGGDCIIVARRKQLLQELQQELEETYDSHVTVVQQDLSTDNAAQKLVDHLEKEQLTIDYLINNAGIGGVGPVHQRDRTDDKAMINLNIKTLTGLTSLLVPKMIDAGGGKVLNVASVAGFLPGPLQAVYFASKAYVISFSEAIANELQATEVSVTCLCPGATQTDFFKQADFNTESTDKMADPAAVAKLGYDAMLGEIPIVIDGRKNRFMVHRLAPLLPRSRLLHLARQFNEQ